MLLVLSLLAGLVAMIAPVVFAPPASAAPGDAFDTNTSYVFIAQNGPTDLDRATSNASGTVSFTPQGGNTQGVEYNALGYNLANDYLYAITQSDAGTIPWGSLVRIGQGGIVTRVGTSTVNVTAKAGAINGKLLYAGAGTGGAASPGGEDNIRTVVVLNTLTGAVNSTFTLPADPGTADWTFSGGYAWGMSSDGSDIVRIDMLGTHAVQNFPTSAFVSGGLPDGPYGGAWTFGNGNLGFSNNTTGRIYQIDVADPAAATPTFTLVSSQPGPGGVEKNDGAASPGAPADLGIVKAAPATFEAGEGFTYSLTITNHGPGASSGSVVRDTIPAGLTRTGTLPAGCTAVGQAITCTLGPLANGASRVLTIPVTSAPTARACFTNLGAVLGNEADPVTGNNSNSVTSCPHAVTVVKTSDATAETRVGDVVHYTIKATNVGAGAYTTGDPATVVDDLTGVLDDATYDNNAAVAPAGGSLTWATPRLTWTGPLAAGATKTITYSATMKAGGDGTVVNTACDPGRTASCDTNTFPLPRLTITKTADRTTLPAIGQKVTYTVTVKNVGPGVYTTANPATLTDDLSQVLDAADMDTASITSSSGTASFTSPAISWSGALGVNAVTTIKYSVTYNGKGDRTLDNLACVSPGDIQPGAERCATVSIPGSLLTQSKSVSPASGTSVTAGQEVTYTLTFKNAGSAPATVTTSDDLTDVLDDADLTAGPTASAGLTATRNGTAITITGSVASGATSTVTYTVTVKRFGEQGNHQLLNVLACQPGEPDCVPPTTNNPIRNMQVAKTSDAGPDTRVGDTVTYTVTATNNGDVDYTAAAPAVVADSLTGVLDDATYDGDATATIDGDDAGAVTRSGDVLSWSGPLAAGKSVKITYTVKLKAGGNGEVRNVAFLPACDATGTECVIPPAPECDPADPDGTDPATGLPCAVTEFDLPKLTIFKSADTQDLPAVNGVVTYTVKIQNTGEGDFTAGAPATMTDDLTKVLDDAVYNDDAAAVDDDDNPLADPTFATPKVTWSGPLASGDSVTITYSVTYKATPTGDHVLLNQACVPDADADPAVLPCDFVQIPGAALTQWKTVTASTDPVAAGTELTYTLHFKNTGATAADVDAVDNLGGVLDDADVTDGPTGANGVTATRDGDKITIGGSVGPKGSGTVTYTVTVRADGERGDDIAANFLLTPGETPPTDPTCDPAQPLLPNCTATPIGAIEYSKSVSASTDPVGAGTVLTYTVTAHNTGQATANVVKQDNLTDVLDDASVKDQPVSDTGSVTVTPIANDVFTLGGTLAKGATANVVYTVTVNAEGERGNNSAANFLVVPGETPPASCTDGDDCTVTPLPNITSSKSVDPESGSVVKAGDVLTYTLTFHNDGNATGAVKYTDLLAAVVDDAEVTGGPTAAGDLTAALSGTDTINVGGTLAKGDTQTVKYTVKVKPDGQRGDNTLGNFLVRDGETPPTDCPSPNPPEPQLLAAGSNCTMNPVSEIRAWKEVKASESPVKAGTVLTYTLHFENIGAGAGAVEYVDDLSQVLDDADVTSEPASDDLTAVRDGDRTTITGDLGAGRSATVTYTVTVKADGSRGDDVAANFLMKNDPENPPVTPTGPECQPTSAEHPECTTTPIGKLISFKSVSASSDPVVAGTVLTYTLTFDNQGKGAVDVNRADDLTDVLDDATVKDQPAASDDALSASEVADGSFAVTGSLAGGQKVTVTYSVTVNPEDARGNNSAANFLVNPGEDPPTSCEEGSDQCTTTPLPNVTAKKSVDPESGSEVKAGQVLTYTLTFANDGEASGAVDYTDDLKQVLDDAKITDAPKASDDALSLTDVVGDAFRVTGTLAKGQTVTVTYTVRVNPDGERGDDNLGNFLAKTGITTHGDCVEGDPLCTVNPAGELIDWKTVDPESGSAVQPGTVLTYTLHFENTGKADVDVDKVDDLAGVLDDAKVTKDPESSDPALTVGKVEDGTFSVTGSLEPGQSVTVTYQVTVDEDGSRGDDSLGNFLLNPGQEPPTDCVPAGEHPDCTVNPVSNVVVHKTADPTSGTKVKDGQKVTYTLTFENVSKNPDAKPATIDYIDHMAGVLDDADIVAQPKSSDGVLKASKVAKGAFTVTGEVASGKTVTVTYAVKVKAYVAQGDHLLGNFVTVTGEKPPTKCVAGSVLCTENPTVKPPAPPAPPAPGTPTSEKPHGSLPFTGASVTGLLVLAFLLLGGGAALVATRRRRRAEAGAGAAPEQDAGGVDDLF